MRKKWMFTLLAIAVMAAPALAILGLGDIVYDPTNFAEAVQELTQLAQQYAQLVQTYQMIRNQYLQMLQMAQQLPASRLAHYLTPASPWALSSPADAYGNTATWSAGINTGTSVGAGYSGATIPLGTYGSVWSDIPADEAAGLSARYATVELTDGANLATMQTVGQIRASSSAMDSAIASLEADSLSSDPNLNTEIAVLNKINAAHVISLRSQQASNQLLAALAEQQVIQSKRQRDAEAQAFAEHISFMNQAQSAMAAQAAGASDAMAAWRMP